MRWRSLARVAVPVMLAAALAAAAPRVLAAPPSPTAGLPRGRVLILVTEACYEALPSKFERLRQGIARDTGARVTLVASTWADSAALRAELVRQDRLSPLAGALLVGELPVASHGGNPSERPLQFVGRGIWIGRLQPPGATPKERTGLLERYLDRNHAYRNGGLSYPPRMLYGAFVSPPTPEHLARLGPGSWLYPDPATVKVFTGSPGAAFFEELGASAEYCLISARGAETAQEGVSREDVRAHGPGALFVELDSCGTGDASNRDCLASWYLFAGSSLVVLARSTPATVLQDEPAAFKAYRALATGLDFGNWQRLQRSAPAADVTFMFGDPTLRLRTPEPGPRPRLARARFDVDLGEVSKARASGSEPLPLWRGELSNVGSAPLTFSGYRCYGDGPGFLLTPPADLADDDHVVPLGGTATLALVLRPGPPEPAPGRLAWQALYLTNDPANPVVVLKFRVTLVP